MHVGTRVTSVAAVTVLLLNVTVARGQTEVACEQTADVSFVDITDAVAGRFFDAANTRQDPANPKRLVIAFNTGRDPRTWRANDFRASTASFSHPSAMDTISFRIVPPAGCYVSSVKYTQAGAGSVYRTGVARGGSNWVVGDYAADLGNFGTDPDVAGAFDLTGLYLSYVPVSITTGLHAFSTPLLGSATLAITSAEVWVELAQLLPKPVVEEAPPAEDPPPADDPAPPPVVE
jgi:hypothetical protein